MAKLTFDDEFNSLDAGTYGSGKPWSYAYDWSPNGYTDSTISSYIVNPADVPADANVYGVNNGLLTIQIKNTPSDVNPSSVGNDPFVSGQITTAGTFSQEYGYFEVRMQAPTGSGISSAFWMLPSNGSWPPEIDAPEIDSDPTTVDWGIHGVNNAMPATTDYNQPNSSTGMNVYAVDWEPNTITFYENGQEVAQAPTPSNMDTPMYLLLDALANAAGSWNGTPAATVNQSLKVDYVRAYSSNPYVNGLTNPDWTNHGTTASTYTPKVNLSGNLIGFTNNAGTTTPSSPPKAPQSPNNTVITAAQAAKGASIVDASGNAWSIASDGEVSVNGTPDGQSANVIELAYENGLIWQENSADMWWSKSSPSGTWGPTYGTATSPIPAAAPSTSVTSAQLVSTLSSDASLGNTPFISTADGTQPSTAPSAAASPSADQTEKSASIGDWRPGPHNAKIDFGNGTHAGPGKDRNLYVNQVAYAGKTALTATDPLHGNGSVTIHVGS